MLRPGTCQWWNDGPQLDGYYQNTAKMAPAKLRDRFHILKPLSTVVSSAPSNRHRCNLAAGRAPALQCHGNYGERYGRNRGCRQRWIHLPSEKFDRIVLMCAMQKPRYNLLAELEAVRNDEVPWDNHVSVATICHSSRAHALPPASCRPSLHRSAVPGSTPTRRCSLSQLPPSVSAFGCSPNASTQTSRRSG
jgi:hypothetical protein